MKKYILIFGVLLCVLTAPGILAEEIVPPSLLMEIYPELYIIKMGELYIGEEIKLPAYTYCVAWAHQREKIQPKIYIENKGFDNKKIILAHIPVIENAETAYEHISPGEIKKIKVPSNLGGYNYNFIFEVSSQKNGTIKIKFINLTISI